MEFTINLILLIAATSGFIYLISSNSYFKVVGTIYLGMIIVGLI